MATVLSGTSGALYYKPAGTKSTFKAANVTNASNNINVGTLFALVVPYFDYLMGFLRPVQTVITNRA